jgi:hypothetical protein
MRQQAPCGQGAGLVELFTPVGNFFTDVIQTDARFNTTLQIRDLALLEPATRAAAQAIIADAFAMGIDLMVTETFRSAERQKMLFDQRLTQIRTVGTHFFGLALDFCKVVNREVSWAGDWAFLRDLAEKHGLISGLDWGLPAIRHTFVDPDHVQRVSVADQQQLFAGTFYPPNEYQPLAV